jgi:3-dehydroquinate synthase
VTAEPTLIRVAADTSYEVIVGTGILDRLPRLVGSGARRVLLVHQAAAGTAVDAADRALSDADLRVHRFEVPDGEQAKQLPVADAAWTALGRAGFTRSDVVVGVGGGAVTDLAGFVAATWLRGVRVVHVPTTVLGMVDAAVGGKTGLNTDAGKNLVGAVHQPAGVLCDLSTLRTLPRAEISSGLAEVVKCGFIADPAILDLVEANPTAAQDPASGVLRELVERAIAVKARVVGADPYEIAGDMTGELGRLALNYGHTLAHAIERVEDYTWRHGDAVAVGLVFAAHVGRLAGRLDDATCARHASVLRSLGLPTTYDPFGWPALRAAMSADKKARADRLRLVVLDGLARPGLLDDPPEDLLAVAYAAM